MPPLPTGGAVCYRARGARARATPRASEVEREPEERGAVTELPGVLGAEVVVPAVPVPPPVAALLALYPLALWFGRPEGPPSGNDLIDWLPVILALVTLYASVNIANNTIYLITAAGAQQAFPSAGALHVLALSALSLALFVV
jgi:hypothetical protein